MRIKTKWHNDENPKSLEESASVISFIAWKAAMHAVHLMDNEGFRFDGPRQQLDVVGEYVCFLIQVADRLAHERMHDEERARFIQALAGHLIGHMTGNMQDILGPGDYRDDIVRLINERSGDYARFSFVDEQPGTHFLRYLGEKVSEVMQSTDNKWAIEYVSEVTGPEAAATLRRAVVDQLD